MWSRVLLWWVIGSLLLAGCGPRIERLPAPTAASQPGERLEAAARKTPQPALLERRLLVLEWPETIREKDSDLIILSITMDEAGQVTPTVRAADQQAGGIPVEIPDLYETHNVVARARLDMAGLEAYREDTREPLRPGQTVTFRWSIRANEAGVYRGVVWLHVELVPKSGGPVEEILLLARTIEIKAVTVIGLSGDTARILGLLGVFASTVLGYPFIQQWMEKVWKKTPRKKAAVGEQTKAKRKEDEDGTLPEGKDAPPV